MKVYVIARPELDHNQLDQFFFDENCRQPISDIAAHTIVEMAGRICYMSYGRGRKTNQEFVENIIASGHYSVLEHANWTLLITGISRACSHELVRHRHLSFSQLSQRYVPHTIAIQPPNLPPSQSDQWWSIVDQCRKMYDALISNDAMPRKERLGMARSILPTATETKIAVTGNARAWREFIQKRSSEYADQEIRALAQMILARMKIEAPNLFGDLQ